MKPSFPTDRITTAGRGGAVLAGRFVVIAGVNYGFGVALAWLMAPEDFGTVSVIQSLLWLSAMILNSGFPWAVTWSVASASAGTPRGAIIRRSLIGNVALSALLAAGVVGAYAAGVLTLGPGGFATAVVIAWTLPLFAMNAVGRGALHGGARFSALAGVQIAEVFVKAGVALVLVVGLTLGPRSVALGFLVGAAVAAILVVRFNGISVLRGSWSDDPSQRGGIALPLFLATSSMAVLMSADILILQAIGIVPAAIAVYQVAAMLARTPYFVSDAIVDGAFPFVARAHAVTGWSHHHVRTAGRLILMIVIPGELILLVAPEPILWVFFPSTYGDAATTVRLLAIGGLGAVVAGLFGKSLQATGHRWRAARGSALAAIVELITVPILASHLGIEGAAIGFAVAAASGAAWLGVTYLRVHHVGPPAFETIRSILPGLIVLTALSSIAGRVGTLGGIIVLAVAVMAHVTILVRQGEVRIQDVLRMIGVRHSIQGRRR